MASRYGLAGLIWAAILAVAMQLAPTAALAHAGHHHGHAAVQQHASADAQHQATDVVKENGEAQVREPEFAAAGSQHQADRAPTNCVGGCCGAGLGCGCMSAALAGAVQELPLLDTHVEVITFGVRRLGGIDPEALAKPPKSLA